MSWQAVRDFLITVFFLGLAFILAMLSSVAAERNDIKRLVIPVFAHRIVVNSRYSTGLRRSDEAQAALQEILKTVSVPL